MTLLVTQPPPLPPAPPGGQFSGKTIFQSLIIFRLGSINCTKIGKFSENFQTASDPPPSPTEFSENYVALFSGGPKICYEIHSDWRDPPFFRKFIVFTPPKLPKNRNKIFWSLGSFPKIHRFYPPKITEKPRRSFPKILQIWSR